MVAPGGLSGFRAAPDRRELVVYKAEPVAAQIPTITHQRYPGPTWRWLTLAEQLIPVSAAEHWPIDGAEHHEDGTDHKQNDADRRHDADACQPSDEDED